MKISDELLKAKSNNFTMARLVLATLVIYSHSIWAMTGVEDTDELSRYLGASVATCAVEGFFFLSGFLVYPSLIRLASPWRFGLARASRLFPGLAVSVLLTAVVGALFSTAHGFSYVKGDTAKFVLFNLTFVKPHFNLTQVFCGSQLCAVNGSLWTLPYEVKCYIALALLGLIGWARPKVVVCFIIPATVLFCSGWDFDAVRTPLSHIMGHGPAYEVDHFQHLWLCFTLGVLAYAIRGRIRLTWWVAILAVPLVVVAQLTYLGPQVRAFAVAYWVLCLGLLTAKNGPLPKWPDYSYGVYIYAFPVMVLIHQFWGTTNHWLLALATWAATMPFAIASWHFVESRVLEIHKRWTAAERAFSQPGQSPTS